jgi:hypothetical protein
MSINLLKSKNILPSEYQQVEYIQSTGEQYIDTGYIPNQDTFVNSDVNLVSYNANNVLFGQRVAYMDGQYEVVAFKTQYIPQLRYGNQSTGSVEGSTLSIGDHYIETSKNGLFIDNNRVGNTLNTVTFICQYSIYLFARNNAGTANAFSNIKIYSLKISENDVLIRDFIPCYRKSDSKPGMYDTINSVFYTNANGSATQDFIIGPEVGFDVQEIEPYILKKRLDIPSAYQEVEYLENTGEQWITPINYYNNNFKVECSFEVSNLTKTYYLFNAYYDNSNRIGLDYKNPVGCRWGDYYATSTASSLGKHSIVFNKDGFILDGVNIYTPTASLTNRNISPYIFGMNVNGESISKSPAGMKLYSFLLYENNTLIRNFIPCYRKSDNKPGLYDTINSVFYTNSNTSASQDFIVGNDVNKYTLQPVDIKLLVRRPEVPIEYQQIEYLQSTGEQYIDSGVVLDSNSRMKISFKIPTQPTGPIGIAGTYLTNASYRIIWSQSSGRFVRVYRDTISFIASSYTSDILNIDSNKNALYLNGVLIDTVADASFTSAENAWLFITHKAGGGDLYNWMGQDGVSIYSCQIYDNNTLVRNFIPCYRKSDSKPGLYDTINSAFYTNANTSATQDFIVGPDVTVYPLNTIQQL